MSRGGDAAADASLPPAGRLEGSSVPELLRLASESRLDGSLLFSRDGIQKVIYLRGGRVVFAASRDPEDRLGMLLLRRGQVGLVPLLDAAGEIARGRRLGQILIDHGVMTAEQVARAVLDQVREIVLSVFEWRRGDWLVTRVALPHDEPVTLDVSTEELVLEGVRRMRDWRWVRAAVGGPRAIYRAAPPPGADGSAFNLTEKAIVDALEGPTRVDKLCEEVYAPSYDVYRSLWALSILGWAHRVESPSVTDAGRGRPNEGRLHDAGGAAELLLDLGERRFSGVLRLFAARREGALFLRDGRVAFATTNDSERSLLAHLLRRGIVSDRDHEEAVRGLISGKRIGTLLAERGAIEPDEVARFVREQVLDVAKSLVQLADGEYEIEEGLPSREDVVLDRSVEEVVMAACESAEEFIPIWRSFGDVNILFRLTPGYLSRLDRLQLRPSVWELVSLLGEERTLREILAARSEPDFEVCRSLHALEKIRVVSRVSQDEILMRARQAMRDLHPGPTGPVAAPQPVSDPPEVEPAAAEASEGAVPATASELAPELFGEDAAEAGVESAAETAAGAVAEEGPQDAPEPEPEASLDADAEPESEAEASPPPEPEVADETELPGEDEPPATFESLDAPEPELATDESRGDTVEPGADEAAADATSAEEFELDESGAAVVAEPHEPDVDESDEVASFRVPVQFEDDAENEPSDAGPEDDVQGGADPAATQKMSREMIESSLREAVEQAAVDESDELEFEDTDAFPVDDRIYAAVDLFNRRHAIVFKNLRLEIGAGVDNYVASCCERLGEHGAAFASLSPDRNGRFDRDALARAVAARWPDDPAAPLEALVDVEIATVRDFLPSARLTTIERALAEVRS